MSTTSKRIAGSCPKNKPLPSGSKQPARNSISPKLKPQRNGRSKSKPYNHGSKAAEPPLDSTSSTSKPSSKRQGSETGPKVPKFTKTVTFKIKAKGDTALALQALAFVSGRSLEFVALDALSGIDDRATHIADLHTDVANIVDLDELPAMIERLRAYRDSIGEDHYPDEVIGIHTAEEIGMISHEASRFIVQMLRVCREEREAA